jgi:hypothetical protein
MSTIPATQLSNLIPPFSVSGVLPPFLGGDPSVLAATSPYAVTVVELVDRFATSPARKAILTGYLAHRRALLDLGITGIQWLDGSFLEDVENLENRSPNDIDLVTFTWRPASLTGDQQGWNDLIEAHRNLFYSDQSKAAFFTDAYFIDVQFGPQHVIEQAAYWFGLFSHKRITSLWKGMLSIQLSANGNDVLAAELLASK